MTERHDLGLSALGAGRWPDDVKIVRGCAAECWALGSGRWPDNITIVRGCAAECWAMGPGLWQGVSP